MRLGARVFGFLSGILLLLILVGLLLPGTWSAQESALLPAPPSAVFAVLSRLSGWGSWTPFPDTGLEAFGPAEGVGAGIRWDDRDYGRGEARITGIEENQAVEYEVLIEGGSLRIQGRLTLQPDGEGTRIQWAEEGDFGWNPLLGYAARGMASSQANAMKASLDRLAEVLQASVPPSTVP